MNNEPIVIERNFDVPIIKIWEALTNKDQLKQWCFDISGFKPKVGFEFTMEGKHDDRIYYHLCKITELEYCKKLSYTWRYRDFEGDSLVTWELFAAGENQTRLKLTHSGLETFPANNPDFAKHNFVAGWTDIIGRSLKEYLEKPKS